MTGRVAACVVLWKPDLRLFEWVCRGLADQEQPVDRFWLFTNDDPDGALLADATLVASRAGLDAVGQSCAGNIGFSGGHNALLERAFAEPVDHALVLNPDAFLLPDCIASLVAFAREARGPVLLGPVLELADGDNLTAEGRIDTAGIVWTRTGRHLDALQGSSIAAAPAEPTRVAGISGACMLVPRDAYRRVVDTTGEFFDEDFIAYREDAELGLRAALIGVDQWVVPAARGWHVRSQRGTLRGQSAFIDRLGVRNRFLIAFKHGHRRPGGLLLAPLRDLLVVGGVLVRERSSLPGLVEAWRLRGRMVDKRRRMLAAAGKAAR